MRALLAVDLGNLAYGKMLAHRKTTCRRQASSQVLVIGALSRSERLQLLARGLAEVLQRIYPRPALHQFMHLADRLFGAKYVPIIVRFR
jgi:hypothetical protein